MLMIEDLSNDWGRFQLKNINLEVKDGELLVILGPSGSGKTLLLETLAGFTVPDKGSIFIDNEEITRLSPEKRKFGFVYQDFALFPHLSVKENIGFGVNGDQENKIRELAEFLGIDHLLNENPLTLSGGEKQRVTLARALAIEPSYMLFDEPLSSLDERIQAKMRKEIKRIQDEMNLTSIYVTHDQSEAMFLADRIAVMMEGEIVQVGKPEEIFYGPSNSKIAQFVGVENIYEGKIVNKNDSLAKIKVGRNEVEALTEIPENKEVRLMIRPEEVFIKKSKETTTARNQFRCEIVELIDEGSIIRVEMDCGFRLMAYITRKSLKELDLTEGDSIYGSFKANSVHVIK